MEEDTMTSREAAVARRALREVSRLAGEATAHFEEQEYIEAASSLSAVSTVLDALISYMNRQWMESTVAQELAASPIGAYL
jgi:hypothetical protein